MIKHPITDEKITPNQLAKWMIIDAIDARSCDPLADDFSFGSMTDREREEFHKALRKQTERVEKFLNLQLTRQGCQQLPLDNQLSSIILSNNNTTNEAQTNENHTYNKRNSTTIDGR